MYVVEVIPMIKGPGLNSLTYFSRTAYQFGNLVKVPIRHQTKTAIVIRSTLVTEQKTELKKAAFTLNKLPDQTPCGTLPASIIALAEALCKIYPAQLSTILTELLPGEVQTGETQLSTNSSHTHEYDGTPEVLTAHYHDRLVAYRSRIRSALAHRGSVMIVLPTSADLENLSAQLTVGIEDRVVIFSPHQTKRARQAAYQSFEDTTLAKVIFVTPSHAYLDRVDLSTIIIENEGNDAYKSRRRPYLDHRVAIIENARLLRRSILLGDILPRSETEYRRRQDWYLTHHEPTKRIALAAPLSVIEQKDKPGKEAPFALFSRELKQRITETLSRPGPVFLYAARRGLAPVVACSDCGYIFRCPDSGTPYSLIKTTNASGEETRWLVSSVSGRKVKAPDTCPNCGSWRLRERGIGIQTVEAECRAIFPDTPIVVFDSATVTTKKKADALLTQLESKRAVIIIGTNLAVPYLKQLNIDLTAVVSYDATRTIPTWRADEQTLRLILNLRDATKRAVVVQCRSEVDSVLDIATSGRVEDFYTDELALRQTLAYPPFQTFCLLSWQAEVANIGKTDALVKDSLKKFQPDFYASPVPLENLITHHALLRLPCDSTKDELINILRQLPPHIKVELQPDRIV